MSKVDEHMTILMWDHGMVNWVYMVNVSICNVQATWCGIMYIYIYMYCCDNGNFDSL